MIADEPNLFDVSDEEDESKKSEDKTQQIRRELKSMLYGFGDVKEPNEETVDTLLEIVLDYITSVCQKAQSINVNNKITLDDIHFLIRGDPKKYNRVRELLKMSEELKRAKKDLEEVV
uniref:Transcription initiation factor TFIID subunit 13 n=1 Tax=Panagrolaimus sp. JU765 TaxID=591449 RepID=A0AC34RDC9_9BILA